MYHGFTFVALVGLELEAHKPQLLGPSLVTTPALGKKYLPSPAGEEGRVEGSHVSQACPELGKEPRLSQNSQPF